MTGAWPWGVALVPALPLLAATGLWFAPAALAAWLALAACGATLAAALAQPWLAGADAWLRADAPGTHMAVLIALTGLASIWFARRTLTGHAAAATLGAMGFLLLAVLANSVLLAVLGLEGALLVLLLARPLGGHATAGAWRALLLAVAGMGLALVGTVLLARAAIPVTGPGAEALRWDALVRAAPRMAAADLSLAAAFLLAGIATCAGLVPVHGWLAAASRTGGALLAALAGAALLVLLRLGRVMAAGPAPAPEPVLLALGLMSVLVAAGWLVRERRRRPGIPPIVLLYAGLAAFACGLGRAEAGFVLVSALLVLLPAWAVARPHPRVRATALAALALLPPFAGFGAALGVVGAAVRGQPWLAVPFGLGLAVAVAALARHLPGLWRAPAAGARTGDTVAAVALLALALAAGIVPAAAHWFETVARGLS